MSHSQEQDFSSPAVRALVLMQERELRAFVKAWIGARARNVALPVTDDPDYASLEALLRHVLGASRFYVTWLCERLGIPDPGIDALPETDWDDPSFGAFMEQLEGRWRSALAAVPSSALESANWPAPWGAPFTVDSMLEHAVMHPIRHRFQLTELLGALAQAEPS